MGIVVNGPAYIFNDKKSIIRNTMIPGYTLKKKSQSIAYNLVKE